MRYKVFFITGETIKISEKRYLSLVGASTEPIPDGEESFINKDHVTHIIPENAIEAEGTVVRPPKPQTVEEQKKKEEDRIKGDPGAILNRTKEKYNEDETS